MMDFVSLDSETKHIKAIFKKYGLSFTIQMDLYVVSFLDLLFGLKITSHRPYKKSNNDPKYINIQSNNNLRYQNHYQKYRQKAIFNIFIARSISNFNKRSSKYLKI